MDLTSHMNTMLSSGALTGMSSKTGSNTDDITKIMTAALPLLMNGVSQQATNQQTAESFATALNDHSKDNTNDLASFMNGVDLADGAKIISHLLGQQTAATTQQVAKATGTSTQATGQVLSAAAPLLMSLLGQQAQTETKKAAATTNASNVGNLMTALLGDVDIAKLAKTAATAAAVASVAKKATGSSKKSTKNSTGIDLSDGIDASDVLAAANLLLKSKK